MSYLRDSIRKELPPELPLAEVDQRVKRLVAEEVALLLGNVNDKVRPFWWHKWADQKSERQVSNLSICGITVTHHWSSEGYF